MDTRQDGGRLEKSESAFRTISEVGSDLDIPQHVLRFWEGKFPQIKPLKRAGGRRYYRPEDVALLRRIRDLLYGEGYTIKGVQKLLREGGVRTVVAPPMVDMGEEVSDSSVDIIEEDDTDAPLLNDPSQIVVNEPDDVPNVEADVETFPAEEQHADESPAEAEEAPLIALESVLETTPDELLDLFPVIDDELANNIQHDDVVAADNQRMEESSDVVQQRHADDDKPFQTEGDSPDLSLSVPVVDESDGAVSPDPETPFLVVDLSVPLAPRENTSEAVIGSGNIGEMDTVVLDKAGLREILAELESLRVLLRGGDQGSHA